MASTYPLEIVSAARWVKANPKLKDQALEDALQTQTWDPSVKSLTAFPEVLTMMNEKLDWTQKLGDAFLAQQQDVMAAVQRLRAKAEAESNLKTTKQQTVIVEQPAGSQTTVIKIEPANPQVVYVPTYNPTVIYGAWPYPAYPPYAYYPPGYVAATSILSFGVGVAVGSALWGGCDWGRGDVNINVNRYNNFNRTNITNARWEHNVEHRKGVQYRDAVSQQKFNRMTRTGGDAREAFRGRAESGRQELARSGEGIRRDLERGLPGAERGGAEGIRRETERDRQGGERREGLGGGRTGDRQIGEGRRDIGTRDRPEAGRTAGRELGQEHRQLGTRDRQGGDRQRQAEAFQGLGNGREVRRDSDRGFASRQSAAASRASGIAHGGGERFGGSGGGHFSRGGGGRGGGGGGRGGGHGGGRRR
jgi:Protein of unknown function (DUF3300)